MAQVEIKSKQSRKPTETPEEKGAEMREGNGLEKLYECQREDEGHT